MYSNEFAHSTSQSLLRINLPFHFIGEYMDIKPTRKFVPPKKLQKSLDLQKGVKDGYVKCSKCLKTKKQEEYSRKNWYWCKPCHNEYSRKRPKKVSYNQLW